jgi:hypothetical protein
MNPDDFETRLQRQPMRQIPGKWRGDILSTARQVSPAEHAPRTTHHALASRSLLSTLNHQLSTLLWPHPTAWAGLAAAWLVILGINLTTRDAAMVAAKHAAPVAPQVFMAFQEQERLLSELIGPRDTPVAERPKPRLPLPRSERGKEMLMAQSGQAAIELREAFGVRGACSRLRPASAQRQRQQAGRTPIASRSSSATETIAAREQSLLCRA